MDLSTALALLAWAFFSANAIHSCYAWHAQARFVCVRLPGLSYSARPGKRDGRNRGKEESMIVAIGPLRVCLIILCLGLLVPATAQAQGKWTKLVPFPEPAEEL